MVCSLCFGFHDAQKEMEIGESGGVYKEEQVESCRMEGLLTREESAAFICFMDLFTHFLTLEYEVWGLGSSCL